ncbi:MAG: PilZ domain-containing protein [Methylophaga sp.]|nr:PilZ domain-containing protein [Methylophaga sp.]
MSENDLAERRNCIRIPIETLITFTIDSNDGLTYQGTSQNLCSNGIYITTDYAAKLDDHIKIVLDTYEDNIEPLIAEGKVVRCRFDKKNADLFHISVEFSETHENWIQVFTDATSLAS